MASLTPTTANGLVFNVASIDFHTINSAVGAGYVLDSLVNAADDDNPGTGTANSRLDMDNAFAHIYNTAASPVTFVYTASTQTSGGIRGWGSVASAFVAAPSSAGPPAAPTNLRVTSP